MAGLKNMKLGPKLIAGFVFVAVLILVVGGIGLNSINTMGTAADIILDEEVPIADATMEMTIALISGRDVMGEYLLATDINDLDEIKREFLETVENYDKYMNGILEGADSDGLNIIATDNERVAQLIREADEYHTQFQEASTEMMKFHRQALQEQKRELSNADAMAYGFMEKLDEFSVKAEELQEQAEILVAEEMDAAMVMVDAAWAMSTKLMIGVSVAGFILAFFIGFFLSRSISRPLQTITAIAEDMAKGNLDQNIDINQKDEIGMLADAFRNMVEGLKAKAGAANEIAGGNFGVDITVASEHDVLAKSMVSMRDNLKKNRETTDKVAKFQDGEVEKLSTVLNNMAAGDLTAKYDVQTADEHTQSVAEAFAGIKNALDATLAGLNDILGQVNVAADQIPSRPQPVVIANLPTFSGGRSPIPASPSRRAPRNRPVRLRKLHPP